MDANEKCPFLEAEELLAKRNRELLKENGRLAMEKQALHEKLEKQEWSKHTSYRTVPLADGKRLWFGFKENGDKIEIGAATFATLLDELSNWSEATLGLVEEIGELKAEVVRTRQRRNEYLKRLNEIKAVVSHD